MEINKTQLTADVASALWASNDPMGFEAPLAEQPPLVQFMFKDQVLPLVTNILPTVEKHVTQTVLDKISSGQDNGLSAEEIIWPLQMELSD
jgi:hypothetical protein